MTTEIAVMNKSGIALAADSAVTVGNHSPQGQKVKIYNTANKLFALSKHAPVGCMVYGNATLMGVPWETIIKCYRKGLAHRRFATIEEYCNDLFAFLTKFDMGEHAERDHVQTIAATITRNLLHRLDEFVAKYIEQKGSIAESEVRKGLHDLVEQNYAFFQKAAQAKGALAKPDRTKILRRYSKEIGAIVKQRIEGRPLSRADRRTLVATIGLAISVPRNQQSGLVIAGFGEKELFPACYEFNVDAIISGKLVKEAGRHQYVGHDNSAAIMPFAQADEVETFMTGMGTHIKVLTGSTLKEIMSHGLAKEIVKAITEALKLNETQKKKVDVIVSKMGQGAFDEFNSQMDNVKRTKYIRPVIDAVKFLNKGELAEMAETLVNLVSFRKQVTLEEETVGGPIDVAIITKGDGLIWIKRKYYFDKDLNHHFFNNYFDKGNINA